MTVENLALIILICSLGQTNLEFCVIYWLKVKKQNPYIKSIYLKPMDVHTAEHTGTSLIRLETLYNII